MKTSNKKQTTSEKIIYVSRLTRLRKSIQASIHDKTVMIGVGFSHLWKKHSKKNGLYHSGYYLTEGEGVEGVMAPVSYERIGDHSIFKAPKHFSGSLTLFHQHEKAPANSFQATIVHFGEAARADAHAALLENTSHLNWDGTLTVANANHEGRFIMPHMQQQGKIKGLYAAFLHRH